jgi:hypothetical protein
MRTILVGLILFMPVGVWSQKSYEPMNVKVGQWEVTRSVTTSGEIPISAEMLSKLSPEQRTRMEERIKAMSDERTSHQTYKSCLTKEQLEKGPAFDKEARACSMTIVASTSSRAEVQLACDIQGMNGNGTVHLQALSPEEVKGTTHMTLSGNGKTMNSSSTFTAKWIARECRATD